MGVSKTTFLHYVVCGLVINRCVWCVCVTCGDGGVGVSSLLLIFIARPL